MIIVFGTRSYGRIKACGGSFLATRFAHVWYLPLVPVGSHLVLEESDDGGYRSIAAPFSFKSVLAGYLRVWGPLAVLATIALVASGMADMCDPLALVVVGAFAGVVTLALVAATVLAYAVLGRLSDDEKRQRAVYALHTGYFVDPADMGEARGAIQQQLLETIIERARGLAAMGYRTSADPAHVWQHVALDPTQSDEALITAAFTLARLEATSAPEPRRTQMGQVHRQLWQRILQANPPYLQAALER